MGRWVKRVFLMAVVLISGVTGVVTWVISSETGTRWLVTQLQQWLPGELQVGGLDGRLLDAVQVRDFSYRYQEWSIAAASLELTWQAKRGGLEITRLRGENLSIQMPEFEDKPLTIPDISLPIPVQVRDLRLAPVTVIYANNSPVILDAVSIRAHAADVLAFSQLQVLSSGFDLYAKGSFDLRSSHELTVNLHWSSYLGVDEDRVRLRGRGFLGGDLHHITWDSQLTHPTKVHLQGVLDNLLGGTSKVRWSLQGEWDNLQWPWQNRPPQWQSQGAYLFARGSIKDYQLTLQTRLVGNHIPPSYWRLRVAGDSEQLAVQSLQGELLHGRLQARGRVRWQGDLNAHLQLTAEELVFTEVWPAWPADIKANAELIAAWDDHRITISKFAVTSANAGTALNLAGTANLQTGSPQFQGRLDWREIRWPLTGGAAQIESAQGNLAMEGSVDAYRVELAGKLAGLQIPPGQWQGIARGSRSGLQIEKLQGNLLDGMVTATGKLRWGPSLDWQVAVAGAGLNPASHWASWPGELALSLSSRGRWQAGVLETQVTGPGIKGRLRNYPVHLKTQFAVQGNQFQLHSLDLKSGTAQLTANAALGDTLSGNWRVAISDLATLLPQASGSLRGRGQIAGTLQNPVIDAALNGDGLVVQGHRLRRLRAQVATPQNPVRNKIHLQVSLDDLRRGEKPLLTTLSLSGRGDFAQHRLTLKARAPDGKLLTQLQGGFPEAETMRWEGALEEIVATFSEFGEWALSKPASLQVATNGVRLSNSCLQNRRTPGGTICAELDWQPSTAAFKAELDGVPLSLSRPLLPATWNIGGALSGEVMSDHGSDGALRCQAALRITPGTLTTGLEGVKVVHRHRGGRLQGAITAQGLQSSLSLELEKQGSIEAAIAMPRLTRMSVQATQPVRGRLRMSAVPLAVLPVSELGLEDVRGTVEARISVGGTWARPRLQGQSSIRNGAGKITDLGLDLKDFQLTAKASEGHRIGLDAKVRSGEGWAELKGDLDLTSFPDWQIKANLTGADLEIASTSTAWFLATPDLIFTVKPGAVDIRGDLKIPQGKLAPVITALAQNAVKVSDDTVIVNSVGGRSETAPQQSWRVSSQVQLKVGDEFDLQLADFRSRLQGALKVTKKPHEKALGFGELRLIDGEYRAYGQNLRLRQGIIAFTNKPIDNPTLNIKATRIIYGDKPIAFAGVHITGSLKSPRFSLFSEPPIENQGEILSYLTLGDALNLDDEDSDEPLSFGIYLLPKVYISYGFDRVDNRKIYSARYEIGRRFWIEGEFIEGKFSEEQRGVDFSYIIER